MAQAQHPDIAAQLQQLQQMVGQQQAQLQAQDQRMQQQQQQITTAQARAAAPAQVVIKPSRPSTFHGNIEEDSNLFVAELEAYFAATQAPEASRTGFAIAQLRDTALRWARSTGRYGNPTAVAFDHFRQDFLTRFNPMNSATQARSSLITLRQGRNEPVTIYIDHFLNLMAKIPDMAAPDRLQFFINGLKPSLKIDAVKSVTPTTTLEQAMSLVQRIDTVVRTAFAHNPQRGYFRSNSYNNNYQSRAPSHTHQHHSNTDRMDVESSFINEIDYYDGTDSADEEGDNGGTSDSSTRLNNINNYSRNNNRRVPGLAKDEYDRCMKEGKCFRCKRTGHLARNCPNTSSAPRPNNNNNASKNGKDQRRR